MRGKKVKILLYPTAAHRFYFLPSLEAGLDMRDGEDGTVDLKCLLNHINSTVPERLAF